MRHGHVDYFGREVRERGHTDSVPLTPLGQEQARASGLALAHVRFDRALCSGLPRTWQTAELVLQANVDAAHLTLDVDRDLVEIKGGGLFAVKSREELAARMTFEFDQAAVPGARMMGGDAFADVQARSVGALLRLLAAPDWHTALVVAHEGVNRLVLSWMAGNGLVGTQTFEQDLACINLLDFRHGAARGRQCGHRDRAADDQGGESDAVQLCQARDEFDEPRGDFRKELNGSREAAKKKPHTMAR